MQVNLPHNVDSRPQFGMAVHSNSTINKVIKSRVKNSKDIERLSTIIDNASKNNLFDVNLFLNPDGKSLSANVFSTNADIDSFYCKSFSENVFTRMFGGVVGFIDKVVKHADKQAEKFKAANNSGLDDILKTIE